MTMQLSPDEISRFLNDIGISIEDKLKLDKTTFLKQVITAFSQHVPFTNLNQLLIPKHARHVPSWDTVKENVMSLRGGMCFELNTFMCALLSGLGYRVYCSVAQLLNYEHPTHAIVVVKDLQEKGDTFLVDLGIAQPAFDAFPLDFEVESTTYQHNYVKCKYSKVGEHYVRQQLAMETDPFIPSFEEAQWVNVYTFKLDAFSLDELALLLDKTVYLHSSGHPFHNSVCIAINPPGMSYVFKATSREMAMYEANCEEMAPRKRIVNSANELKTFVEQYMVAFSWSSLEFLTKGGQQFAFDS